MANERKNNLFKQVPVKRPKRSLFDLSHEVKMSGKFGFLYPVLCVDTLPGDTFRDTMNCMVRFAPMLAPVMHRLDVTTHFFFVPNRLLTDHWEDFITGGRDGDLAPVLPYVTPNGLDGITQYMRKGSLWDYLGLPVYPESGGPPAPLSNLHISVLPFRAVGKVYNDFYRDPNLDDELDLDEEVAGDVSVQGALATSIFNIENYHRGFEKDYFTSALPWAQRGAQVLMPLSGVADSGDVAYRTVSSWYESTGASPAIGTVNFVADGVTPGRQVADSGLTPPTRVENIESITFDNAATTINDFRRALAIQRWLEANARGGARYTEQIQSHFDVMVPDYRLQRAEYLGGGRQPVQISEVLSTASNEGMGDTIVGDMAGHGISVGRTNRFTYRCQEHGFVLGFLSVTMRTAYSQGVHRMWTRDDKYDYAWPELAHLGEQEILSRELFFDFDDAADAVNDGVFGYIPRYAEYKFQNDRVAGDFRDTLGFWHLSRRFLSRPSLDSEFLAIWENGGPQGAEEEETFRRIFAVQDGTDYLWMQLYHHLTVKRPLPYFGVPSII